MKKKIEFFSWIILFFCHTSCNKTDSIYKIIDLEETICKQCVIEFDDIFELQECIPLQSSPSCMLNSHASILDITDSDIIIRNDNEVLRFYRDGTFANIIGVYGHGYSEHGKILSVCSDGVSKVVYILTFEGKIYHYSYDGVFLGIIPIQIRNNESIRSIYHSKKDALICEIREDYSQGVKVQLRSFESNGKLKKTYDLYKDNYSVSISLESFPIGYSFSDGIKIKLAYDNRLHYFSDSSYVDMVLDAGHLQANRYYIEDVNNKRALLNEKLQLLDIEETASFLFIVAYYNKKYYAFIYDKYINSFIMSSVNLNPRNSQGLKFDGLKDFEIWPMWCKNKTATSLVSPESVITNHSLFSQYNICGINEDSNPIVFIYKERTIRK